MTTEDAVEMILPRIAVDPRWSGRVWLLYWTAPCPWCGAKHQHGGGDGGDPSYGARGLHCAGEHKPFREDCERTRNAGNQTVCRVVHYDGQVELVPA